MNREEISYVVDLALDDVMEECKVVVDVGELLEEDLIVSSEAGLMDPLGQLRQFIVNTINSVSAWLNETIVSGVKGFIDWLWQQISPALTGIGSWIQEATQRLTDLGSVFQGFVNAILQFPNWFPTWFKENIADPISGALESLAKWIWEHLPGWLREAIQGLKNALESLARDPLGTLKSALAYLASQLWSLLPEWLRNALTGLQKAWASFVKSAEGFFKDPWGNIRAAFESLAKWIWDNLPDWLRGAIQGFQSWISDIQEAFREFLKDPAGWISARLQDLAKWIWEQLPEPVKGFFAWLNDLFTQAGEALWKFFAQDLPGFFGWLWQGIQEFVEDPLGWLQKNIVEPVWGGLTWLWEQASAFFSDVAGKVVGFFRDLGDKLMDALKGAAEWAMGLVKGLLSWLSDVTQPLRDAIVGVAKPLLVDMPKELAKQVGEFFTKLFKPEEGGGAGELEFLPAIYMAVAPFFIASLLAPRGFKALSHVLAELRARLEGALQPLGLGGRIVISIMSRINQVLYELGDLMEKVPLKFLEAFGLGAGVVAMLPIRYPMTYAWKQYFRGLGLGDIPFELPAYGETLRLVRRVGVEEARDRIRDILMYRGYPDWFIENTVAPVEELKLEITDRFGSKRVVPLALTYAQPSLSELTTMMIRDIFGVGPQGLEQYAAWAYRLGLYKDVAYLYYLLHFRYPSPERLWEFTARGLAGLLWYEPTRDEVEEASAAAKALGAKAPVAPASLNFEGDKLLGALRSYMKWHDYANFAWIEGFTSDNWLMMDVMADIPEKVDIRWMTRWGLFDFLVSKLAARGLNWLAPASQFIAIVDDRPVNEKVFMDLTMMCRLLQSRGLHPYYVPLVAVAETMNAFADERTLLRTGILDIYRYGAMDYETLDSLMSNLVTVSFAVAYYDVRRREWRGGYVNAPLVYLPAERKLLALRAVIDRYVRVVREMLTEIEAGYREYVIGGDEARKYLRDLMGVVNKYFGPATQDIAGRELAMKLDEAFITSILQAWGPARVLYTVRRIRYWFYRVLGWLVYRLAHGYVRYEDIEDITRIFAESARLAPLEAETIEKLAKRLVDVAAREYIPTPSQLATMAEVVPAARALTELVLEERRVPEEWRPIWRRYITVKPLVDEVRRLLTVVENLYEYFMIDERMYDKFLSVLRGFGWEPGEIGIMKDRGNVLRWYRAYRELVGTPRELLTMAEYVPRARRLVLAEVKKRIDALPIPDSDKQFLYGLWEDYIRIRPVYDEVRSEVTELINDYARGVITWEQFTRLLEELKKWGLDDYEIDAYKFLAMARRARYAARAS